MPISFAQLRNAFPFSRLFRQVEQEMETVVRVLQPGPLGVLEHKFSAEEMKEASATVARAVANWKRNTTLEQRNHLVRDYVQN